MRQKLANSDWRIAQRAARQHGIATTAQLAAAGLDASAIRRRVASGRLHRVHRGVYSLGYPPVTPEALWIAAVMACTSPGARDGRTQPALSHRSAAELWGLLPRTRGPVHVTISRSAGRARRRGLVLHRSTTLVSEEVRLRSGIPVTVPGRTLRDLRRAATAALHQRAARRALDLGLVTPEALGPEPDLTRSELERRFLRLIRRHRLPRPQVNARVGRHEVDFLWAGRRLVVETDGFRYHGNRAAFERDRARDAALQTCGYRVLRVTHRQLRDSPERVIGSIRSLLERAG